MRSVNSSMQLTRAADYGVRVMVALARLPRERRFSLGELAGVTDSPESFLSKVLQQLAKGGLILSRRGQSGGFAISDLGLQANMRTVIEAVDGPIILNICLADGHPCKRAEWCPAHPVWVKAQAAMLSVLEEATIAGMAADNHALGGASAVEQTLSVALPIIPCDMVR